MGFGGIGPWQLLIILAIVVVIFGTKRLRGIGTDLGSAIKGFRSSLKDDATEDTKEETAATQAKTEQLPPAEKADSSTASAKTGSTEKDKV
ncbi:twin-arginine translocase TatA/TatE family subunit [Arsukibacterium sp.]|uniref:twin-arginine translocase TatA/TatE family subunit n=1 Tax=Arsukibacterium sp. TaxID=1977258 RepID=UPI002FDB0A3C